MTTESVLVLRNWQGHLEVERRSSAPDRVIGMAGADEIKGVHRLTKAVNSLQGEAIPEIVAKAEQILATIPKDRFGFERAQEDVMEKTSL